MRERERNGERDGDRSVRERELEREKRAGKRDGKRTKAIKINLLPHITSQRYLDMRGSLKDKDSRLNTQERGIPLTVVTCHV